MPSMDAWDALESCGLCNIEPEYVCTNCGNKDDSLFFDDGNIFACDIICGVCKSYDVYNIHNPYIDLEKIMQKVKEVTA